MARKRRICRKPEASFRPFTADPTTSMVDWLQMALRAPLEALRAPLEAEEEPGS